MTWIHKGDSEELGLIPLIPLKKSGKSGKRKVKIRSFVAWDGESVRMDSDGQPVYTLLGNSDGAVLLRPDIGTKDALEFLLENQRPDTYNVGYYFDYDVNFILRDLPQHHLKVLGKYKQVMWNGYFIQHIPRKKFEIRHEETGRRIRIDDVFDFFLCRFEDAIERWDIGSKLDRKFVASGKQSRSDFTFEDIDGVLAYWECEIRLMAELMESVKSAIHGCGFPIHRWYGPSAISSLLLTRHGVARARAATPPEILGPALTAYAGGWFDRYKVGYYDGTVHKADLNSAFAAAMARVPNMARGEWRHIPDPAPELARTTRFGLFHIRLGFGDRKEAFNSLVNRAGIPQPLFIRDRAGATVHPTIVDGWYWNPEAATVVGHPDVEFVEAWVFDDDGTYPLAWIEQVYEERLKVKDEPVEKLIKWALAAVWGRAAQHAGWNRRTNQPPAGFQIEWAGWATSYIRATVFRVAHQIGRRGGLISIDADGILSTIPFPANIRSGNQLGEWKLSTYSGILYVGNGIYWARNEDGEWLEPKFRGTPKEMRREIASIWDTLDGGESVLHLVRNSFVGYGQIQARGFSEWRRWISIPYDVVLDASKYRQHVPKLCKVCRKSGPVPLTQGLHDMALVPCRDLVSHPAPLPWARPDDSSQHHEIATEYM